MPPATAHNHHIVPRFHQAHWAGADGLIETFDVTTDTISLQDPAEFDRIRDFNTVFDADGAEDTWIEHELLAGLDNEAARAMGSLVHTDPVKSHLRKIKGNGWHPVHLMSPRRSAGFAMFLAAQAVRSPSFREAATNATGRVIGRKVREHCAAEAALAASEDEHAHFEYMATLRLAVAGFDQNTLPHLAATLVSHLGEVLYSKYMWSVHRFTQPVLMLGDDPIIIVNENAPTRSGSFGQVATAGDDPFSLWDAPHAGIARAVAKIEGNDGVLFALDPRHLLLLARPARLVLPGRYAAKDEFALLYNLLLARASRRWWCRPRAESKPAES